MCVGGQIPFKSAYAKYLFNLRGYNRLGLFRDDCVRETPITKEAIRRLPKQIQDERTYRSLRAIQADINKQILPKEQWTKPEEEVDYLTPYIKQVEAEEAEKKEWYRTH
ncbi:cytochrome b-c1 complex subunit 7-like [Varroa jacobsoni]|uniref:cytochrome b-c1 complex subunit 7-like n=1 Tax=Varroa jacobsoni TaxID=62625 RepID=UPI000BF89C7A|nr:cytochrome b-c1 complex subunit 7-like [Varroa jacobsoni]